MVSVIFSKSGKRLGDIVAGTIVVREGLVRQLAPGEAKQSSEAPAPLDAMLTEAEFLGLERFMERRGPHQGAGPGTAWESAAHLAAHHQARVIWPPQFRRHLRSL